LSMKGNSSRYLTCVKNLEFHAAHATPVNGIPVLHGHTFIVSVCIEGELTEKRWVIDFTNLHTLLKEIIDNEYNFRLLLDKKNMQDVKIVAPFEVRLAYIDGPPTAESLARDICQKLSKRIAKESTSSNIKSCSVTVCEGNNLCAEYVAYFTTE